MSSHRHSRQRATHYWYLQQVCEARDLGGPWEIKGNNSNKHSRQQQVEAILENHLTPLQQGVSEQSVVQWTEQVNKAEEVLRQMATNLLALENE